MQSTWAIGEMIAAAVTLLVLPRFGWRAVFFVGVLPALVVLWIRRGVPESDDLARARSGRGRIPRRHVASGPPRERRPGDLMNACGMFGYWGLFTWIPGYLALPESQGGRGLGMVASLDLGALHGPRANGWATPCSASPPTPSAGARAT